MVLEFERPRTQGPGKQETMKVTRTWCGNVDIHRGKGDHIFPRLAKKQKKVQKLLN